MCRLLTNNKAFMAVEALSGFGLLVGTIAIVMVSLSQLFVQVQLSQEKVLLYHELSNQVVSKTYGKVDIGKGYISYQDGQMMVYDGQETVNISKISQE